MPHPRPSPAVRGLLGPLLLLACLPAGAGAAAAAQPTPAGAWPLWPTSVVAPFDPPTTVYGHGHRGVDLLGSPGQAVRAALPGTVRFAGLLAGRPVVVVDDGTTRTTYEPVAPGAGVTVGTTVAAAARLGTLQATPSHCAPRACLHWGWIRDADDVYLDPLGLVGRGEVRLLPLAGLPGAGLAPGAAYPRPGARPTTGAVGPEAPASASPGGRRPLDRWW